MPLGSRNPPLETIPFPFPPCPPPFPAWNPQEAEATRELEKGSVPPRTPLPLTPPIALPSSFPTTASLLDSPALEGDYPSHHPAPTRKNTALFLAPPAPASVPLSMLSPPPSKIPRLLSPQPLPSQGAPGGSREAGGAEMTSTCMSTDESFQLEPNAMTMDGEGGREGGWEAGREGKGAGRASRYKSTSSVKVMCV